MRLAKIAKYLLAAAAGLLAIAALGAGVFALTFDPNRYRGDIERLAKERTGRTLKLEGPLSLAFFPSLGAKVADVTLSERASEREFLSLESAHASVALFALLRGQLIVDRIDVTGLKANVVKAKDGRYNFSDLLEPQSAKPAPPAKGKAPDQPASGGVKFDIAGVDVKRASIAYSDLATGRELALSDVKLATGRVAERADGKLEFAASAKGRNPALDARINLSGDYRYDLAAKSVALSKVDGAVKGTLDRDTLEAKISAPRIDVTADKAAGDAVSVEFRLKGPQRTAEATLKLSGVQGSAKALLIPSLSANIAVSGADMPKAMKLPITGSVRADLEKQTAAADLSAKLDESSMQVKIGLTKFAPPAYSFDINVDRLNLDQYFPPASKSAAKPAVPAPAAKDAGKDAPQEPDSPVDLSALKDLNAHGQLQFGALQVKGLKLANVKAEIKAANGRMDVSPHSARLYEGTLAGALSLQANNHIALKESLSNVSVGPLLRDAAHQDRLEGRGNVALDINGAGATVNAIKKSLAGSAKVNLRDGAIKGVNIAEILRKARSALGPQSGEAAGGNERTDFTALTASFTIKNGVAHNQDLDIKAPLLRIGGAGDIDIGNSRLDYVTKASVVATAKGQGGADLSQFAGLTVPVRLTGSFDALKYQVDYGAVAADLAKSKIGQKLEERLGIAKPAAPGQPQGQSGPGGGALDKLRGLIGR